MEAGSNAIRLLMRKASRAADPERVNLREAVRLGDSVFTAGRISDEAMEAGLGAFQRFRQVLDQHRVIASRAVGTSASREASNRETFVRRVAEETGIHIEVITEAEEARLVHLAVRRAVDFADRTALLVDIGGGSVQAALVNRDRVIRTESMRLGGVRLAERMRREKLDCDALARIVEVESAASLERLGAGPGGSDIDLCAGAGGSIGSLGFLRRHLWDAGDDVLTRSDLNSIITQLANADYNDRIVRFGLHPDRADVIVPAAVVLGCILGRTGVEEVRIPRVGVREGLFWDALQRCEVEGRHQTRR